jgi:multiple sugar transport system permease protein
MAVNTVNPGTTLRALRRREMLYGYLMIAPNFLGFVVFLLGPIIFALAMSFTEFDLVSAPKFIGLGNYVRMIQDDQFWLTLAHTAYFSLLAVPLSIVTGLGLALATNRTFRFVSIYRAAFFVPVVSSAIAVALIWKVVYNTEFGLLNYLLSLVGLPPQNWLTDPNLVIPSIALVWVWKTMGYNMIIFLAGLKGIPRELYDAAAVDGANPIQRFLYITLPLLTPTMFFVVVISLIGSFQVFDTVYAMTGGGPGDSSRVYYYWLWQNGFQFFRMGYASALAWVLFAILFVITIVQIRTLGRRVQYDLT